MQCGNQLDRLNILSWHLIVLFFVDYILCCRPSIGR